MAILLKEVKFEDGIYLILTPCILNLQIGGETFAAQATRINRRNGKVDETRAAFFCYSKENCSYS
jgi:hypothetical protein